MTETPVTPTIHLAAQGAFTMTCGLAADEVDDSGADRATTNSAQVTCDACKTASAAAAPVADPETLLRIARRVGMFHVRSANAAQDYKGIKRAAELAFAPVRRRGTTNQEILLPDGTKAGLISITTGGSDVTVDEDLLTGVIAGNDPRDFEDYVPLRALSDPRVVALLSQFLPDLVERRVRPDIRARYQAELLENAGRVTDRNTGERVTVAVITPREATGEYSVTWTAKGRILLQEAVDAGLLAADGSVVAPPVPDGALEEDRARLTGNTGGDPDADPAAVLPDDPCAPAGDDEPQARAPLADDSTDARYERAVSRSGSRGRAPDYPPTGEQQAIIDAFAKGQNVAITARAGTGKTSVLQFIGDKAGEMRKRGLYVAFGKDIVRDARGKFASGVRVSTAHALAKGAVGHPYQERLDSSKYLPAREVARILKLTRPLTIGDHNLTPYQLSRLTTATLKMFCESADFELTAVHVPAVPGLDGAAERQALASALVPAARLAWEDINRLDGQLRFTHDHYLKMWQLTEPVLRGDFLLFDEAQDADPVVLDVISRQKNMQLIPVGDDAQAIFEWRGAVNSLDLFDVDVRLPLSRSFRFGPAIAGEANKWLTLLDARPLVTGSGRIGSAITHLARADAILCRSNAQAIAEVIAATTADLRVSLVGDGKGIVELAKAACELKQGQPASHPELFAFNTWAEVQDYAEHDPGGSDLRVLVRLIDENTPEKIIAVMAELVAESQADVVVSTAHASKGREWESVKIAADFHSPTSDEVPAQTARLAYVAVTRARLSLDRGGLSWVDEFLPAPPDPR